MDLFEEKFFNARESLVCVISKANQPAFILRLSSSKEVKELIEKLQSIEKAFEVYENKNEHVEKLLVKSC